MDQRKQLAQRLSIGPATRHKKGMSIPGRSLIIDRRSQPNKHLRPRLLPSLHGPPTARTDLAQRSLTPRRVEVQAPPQLADLAPRRARPPIRNETKKEDYIHGAVEYPPMSGRAANPFDLIEVLRVTPGLVDEFWYLNRRDRPYDYEFVPFDKRNLTSYVTLSARGVTYFMDGTTEFLTLDEWEREYYLYNKIIQIPFFKTSRKWKNFMLWKNVRRKSMLKQRGELLNHRLLFLDPMLKGPILALREQAHRLLKADLVDFSADGARSLDKFNADQETRRQVLTGLLADVETHVTEAVGAACQASMEQFYRENRTNAHLGDEVDEDEERDPFIIGDEANRAMTYTQNAVIKTHFTRLTKFVTLADYQMIDAKLALTKQSTEKLLQIYIQYETSSKPLKPIFGIECCFDETGLVYFPMPVDLKAAIHNALHSGYSLVCTNELLLGSAALKQYVLQAALSSFQEPGYTLNKVLDDQHILRVKRSIDAKVEDTFTAVESFGTVYLPSIELYWINEQLDINSFRTVTLTEFREALDLYKGQMADFESLAEATDVGIYQVWSTPLKNKLRPNPKNCLDQVKRLMPQLSLERSESLLSILQEGNRELMHPPVSVDEYIHYNKFFSHTDKHIKEYGAKLGSINSLNMLMDEYYIRYDEVVKQKYTECVQAIAQLKQRLDAAGERNEGDRIKFRRMLEKQIVQLGKTVREANEKLKDDQIRDKEAQPGMVMLFMKEVGEQVERAYSDSLDFITFQDELDLDKSDFTYVEETKNDYRLKRGMWSALYEWSYKVQAWVKTPVKELDTDTICQEVEGYYQVALESKALEEQGNYVPGVLKTKVDALRDTLPVAIHIRSPDLVERHWDQIREAFAYHIDLDQKAFTLQSLLDLRASTKAEKVAEIALRATKEHELEQRLSQALAPWDVLEIDFEYFKDKDFYTLGSVDAIVDTYQETVVELNSIATNHYIVPIYHQIDPWIQKFKAFWKAFGDLTALHSKWCYLEKIFKASDFHKQIPIDFKKFTLIDASYKRMMRGLTETPLVLGILTNEEVLQELLDSNTKLDLILKQLDECIEKKRKQYPRLFFLSNDQIVELLVQAKVTANIQPHLPRLFQAVHRVEFAENKEDVLAIYSPEGEQILMSRNLKARGPVEEWVKAIDNDIMKNLKREIKENRTVFEDGLRPEAVAPLHAQVAFCVSQLAWTAFTEEALVSKEGPQAMEDHLANYVAQLEELVKHPFTDKQWMAALPLVVQTIRNRDCIDTLKTAGVSELSDFRWQQQLRYYFSIETEECVVKQMNGTLNYGYEYQGMPRRTVLSPLTDRCCLAISSALQLKLGATVIGTQTEVLKEVGMSLGRNCIFFECSASLGYRFIERFTLGLAITGMWGCLTKLERVKPELLTLFVQQLHLIRNIQLEGKTELLIDEKSMALAPVTGVFLASEQQAYARVSESTKQLFRTVAVLKPDLATIADLVLSAHGYTEGKRLGTKLAKFFSECEAQLTSFRASSLHSLNSILTLMGRLRKQFPEQTEDLCAMHACTEWSEHRLLPADVTVVNLLLSALFPDQEFERPAHELASPDLDTICAARTLVNTPVLQSSVAQLAESMEAHLAVVLVGPASSGKSTCYSVLSDLEKSLEKKKTIYPAALETEALLGHYNQWNEWVPGVFEAYFEEVGTAPAWLIIDAPLLTEWTEPLVSMLTETKRLCTADGKRLRVPERLKLIIETENLSSASPSLLAQCGILHFKVFDWKEYVNHWIKTDCTQWPAENSERISDLLHTYIPKGLELIRSSLTELVPTTDLCLVKNMCRLFTALSQPSTCPRMLDDDDHVLRYLEKVFVFSFVWGLASSLDATSAARFDNVMATELLVDLPKGSLFGFCISTEREGGDFAQWEKIRPEFEFKEGTPLDQMLVPTRDVVRFQYFLTLKLQARQPVLLAGCPGSGKTCLVRHTLNEQDWHKLVLNLTAVAKPEVTQSKILAKLEKKRANAYGAISAKHTVLFVDDINLPPVNTHELFREYLETQAVPDRQKHFAIKLLDSNLVGCAVPPAFGRKAMSQRLTRHLQTLALPSPNEEIIGGILKPLLEGFLRPFKPEVQAIVALLVRATGTLFETIKTELPPTPGKPQYQFSLREVIRLMQGIQMGDPRIVSSQEFMISLWVHECCRVFLDRSDQTEDKVGICKLISRLVVSVLRKDWTYAELFEDTPLLMGNFLKGELDSEDRVYDKVVDMKKTYSAVTKIIDTYNTVPIHNTIHLKAYLETVEQLFRICRVLQQPQGHLIMVSDSGTGKQSLTKLSAFICGLKCVSTTSSFEQFKIDLKQTIRRMGLLSHEELVFLISDFQIKNETIMEMLNSLLVSGEVHGLFSEQELEEISTELRPLAEANCQHDDILGLFTQRVKAKFHLVLCITTLEAQLKDWLRKYPALLACCNLNFMRNWSDDEALFMSRRQMRLTQFVPAEEIDAFAEVSCAFHQSALDMASSAPFTVSVQPKHFIDMLQLFNNRVKTRIEINDKTEERLREGLRVMQKVNEEIERMIKQHTDLQGMISQSQAESDKLTAELTTVLEAGAQIREQMTTQEAEIQAHQGVIDEGQSELQADLSVVMPEYQAAAKALEQLSIKDIAELKAYIKPPPMVRHTLDLMNILFADKPELDAIKKNLQSNLVDRLKNLKKEQLAPALVQEFRAKLASNPKFAPDTVETPAGRLLCEWVFAVDRFLLVYESLAPKREVADQLKAQLNEMIGQLNALQTQLTENSEQVSSIESQIDGLKNEQERLNGNERLLSARLARGNKVKGLLTNEHSRWQIQLVNFNAERNTVRGDSLLAAAFTSYCGPHTEESRGKLLDLWLKLCAEKQIVISEEFQYRQLMAEPASLLSWHKHFVVDDPYTVNTATATLACERWPLLVDPHRLGVNWLLSLRPKVDVRVAQQFSKELPALLESSVKDGAILIVEGVYQEIDGVLDSVLDKKAHAYTVKIRDREVEVDPLFRLVLVTPLEEPVFHQKDASRVTLLNFLGTTKRLSSELKTLYIQERQADAQQKRATCLELLIKGNQKIEQLEEAMISGLIDNEETLLDDPAAIESIETSYTLLNEFKSDKESHHSAISTIDADWSKLDSDLQYISSMYSLLHKLSELRNDSEWSFPYFTSRFVQFIHSDNLVKDLEADVLGLVHRGQFAKHEQLFKIQLAALKEISRGRVSSEEWKLFFEHPEPVPDSPDWLSPEKWAYLCCLQERSEVFSQLCGHLTENIDLWARWVQDLSDSNLPAPYSDVSSLHKLLLVRGLAPEKLTYFVDGLLTGMFDSLPPLTVKDAFEASSPECPLIIYHTAEVDPLSYIMRLAVEYSATERLELVTMGKETHDKLHTLLETACSSGKWVVLHDSQLFSEELQQLCEQFLETEHLHEDFRLILASQPGKALPPALSEKCIKTTIEAAEGVRARSASAIDLLVCDNTETPPSTALTAVALLHALLSERHSFGGVGFNEPYKFDLSNIRVCLKQFPLWDEKVDAQKFIVIEEVYGQQFTDPWDLRCLAAMTESLLSPTHKVADSASLSISSQTTTMLNEFVTVIPGIDRPEEFGIHKDYADLTIQQVSASLFSAFVPERPIKATFEVTTDFLSNLIDNLPEELDLAEAHESLALSDDDPLMRYFTSEVRVFNTLLATLKESLTRLLDAFQGVIFISEDQEQLVEALKCGKLPEAWRSHSYASPRPLLGYLEDLKERIALMKEWLTTGGLAAFSLGHLFRPKHLLMALLEGFSRKYSVPLETAAFSFDFQTFSSIDEVQDIPEDGCLIYGLHTEGCRWDFESTKLQEQTPGERFALAPVIFLEPTESYAMEGDEYCMPVYYTVTRREFVTAINCPTSEKATHWILRGAAFICSLP